MRIDILAKRIDLKIDSCREFYNLLVLLKLDRNLIKNRYRFRGVENKTATGKININCSVDESKSNYFRKSRVARGGVLSGVT